MGAVFHGSAGMAMSLAWFFFFDGFQIAKNSGENEFTFLEWLPGLLCLVGFLFLSFVVPEHIIGGGDDDALFMGGGADMDDSAVIKSKFLFLFGYFMMFAGLAVGIWRLVEPYAKEDSPTAWPGVALMLQCGCIAASSTLCLIGRKKVDDEGLMFM